MHRRTKVALLRSALVVIGYHGVAWPLRQAVYESRIMTDAEQIMAISCKKVGPYVTLTAAQLSLPGMY